MGVRSTKRVPCGPGAASAETPLRVVGIKPREGRSAMANKAGPLSPSEPVLSWHRCCRRHRGVRLGRSLSDSRGIAFRAHRARLPPRFERSPTSLCRSRDRASLDALRRDEFKSGCCVSALPPLPPSPLPLLGNPSSGKSGQHLIHRGGALGYEWQERHRRLYRTGRVCGVFTEVIKHGGAFSLQ